MDDGHASQLELFRLPDGMSMGEFQPTVMHDKPSDTLVFIEQNHSCTEEPLAGSSIVLMRSNETGQVVGIRIEGYSTLRKDL